MTHIITPSAEQLAIIEKIDRGENLIVDAVAGSGKTTVVLCAAQRIPNKRFTLCTYNKRLAEETNERVASLGLKNLMAYTYHGLAGRLYMRVIQNDQIMEQMVEQQPPRPEQITKYVGQILIIDEQQDMQKSYALLIAHVLRGALNNFIAQNQPTALNQHVTLNQPATQAKQLVCMGDWQQAVYEYKGSDSRFLTAADVIFGRQMQRMPLYTSRRITRPMAWFLNHCTRTGRPNIMADKNGPPIVLIESADASTVIVNILGQLKRYGIRDHDCMICANTLRVRHERSSLAVLQRRLTAAGHLVQCSTDDYEERDARAMRGKLQFSTVCAAKGRERRVVIVYNVVDQQKNPHRTHLTNAQYVSLTRASDLLIIVKQGSWSAAFDVAVIERHTIDCPADKIAAEVVRRFTHATGAGDMCILRVKQRTWPERQPQPVSYNTTALCSHLDGKILYHINTLLDSIVHVQQRAVQYDSNIVMSSEFQPQNSPTTIVEEHQNINALAIGCLLEMRHNACHMWQTSMGRTVWGGSPPKDSIQQQHATHNKMSTGSDFSIETIRLAVWLAVQYESTVQIYSHRQYQINRYDILDTYVKQINELCRVYAAWLPLGCQFEQPIIIERDVNQKPCQMRGVCDAVVERDKYMEVFEFKYTGEFTIEHCLQTVLYAAAFQLANEKRAVYKQIVAHLVNLRNGCMISYYMPSSAAVDIFDVLMMHKMRGDLPRAMDDVFLADIAQYFDLHVNRQPVCVVDNDAEQCNTEQVVPNDSIQICGQVYRSRTAAQKKLLAELAELEALVTHTDSNVARHGNISQQESVEEQEYCIVNEPSTTKICCIC